MQDIADRIGLIKGSLYYYIRTKEDLLYEIVRKVLDEGLRRLEDIAEADGPASDRLRAAIVEHVRHLMRNHIETAVFLHEFRHLSREKRMRVPSQRYEAIFQELVSKAQAEGTVRADVDPELETRVLLGAANWVYRWYRPGDVRDPDVLSRQIADVIIKGLAT